MKFNKGSLGALTLSSLMMSVTPAYAVPTIKLATDWATSDVAIELMYGFITNFCMGSGTPDNSQQTCDVSIAETADSSAIRDQVASSGSSGVDFDLFLSSNEDPSDLFYKYQIDNSNYPNDPNNSNNPKVVVGKPFQFASDSVILFSDYPDSPTGMDVSKGFPEKLAPGVTFSIAEPVAAWTPYGVLSSDTYGVVSSKILSSLPNFRSLLKHAKVEQDGGTAYAAVRYVYPTDPSFGSPFGMVPTSLACREITWAPSTYSFYDFSQQKNLKAINSIPFTGVAILKADKEKAAVVNSFISYLTGHSNGNGIGYTAADIMKNRFCLTPVTASAD
jgi:hypothetical protein